ncbi:MAG: hypothetical protein Q4C08_03925 [Pseudomonadota bacterium]|nr:hypothetical protein [Pseudomonadota bacterium]
MSQALFNLASQNFNRYLKEFQERGSVYMLPAGRLTDDQWRQLNAALVQYGVRMVPAKKDGVLYMQFSKLPGRQAEPVKPVQADSDLGAQLKRYTGMEWEHKKAQESGLGYEHYRIKIDDLSQSQVSAMLDALDKNAIYNANTVSTNKGQFLIVGVSDPGLDNILDYYGTVNYNGVPGYVYVRNGMGGGVARSYAERIMQQGTHYAVALNRDGYSGSDYIVVAMRKEDAKKLGAKYQDDILTMPHDNTVQMRKLKGIIGKPLAQINGVPAKIESMSDFGTYSGRTILLVSVGDKKLPFYISTGSAGKTDVPTGKWEFFGGIDHTGWFRKGTLEDILSHYQSPELKQIADALDYHVGDLRDTTDVLKTIGRQYLGGRGDVMYITNAPAINRDHINQSVFNPQNEGIFAFDLRDIKKYLHDLQPTQNKNIAPELNQGEQSVKDKIFARFKAMFQDGNEND